MSIVARRGPHFLGACTPVFLSFRDCSIDDFNQDQCLIHDHLCSTADQLLLSSDAYVSPGGCIEQMEERARNGKMQGDVNKHEFDDGCRGESNATNSAALGRGSRESSFAP